MNSDAQPAAAQPQIKLYWFPISHPAQAAKRMLEHKGLDFSQVRIPAGLQPIAMRAYGFPGITVPGIDVDGEKVQGSLAISRKLEQLRAEPPLFGRSEADREKIEQAETWAERELQPVPRRVFRWLGAHSRRVREAAARTVGAPPALSLPAGAVMLAPFAMLARIGGADEQTVRGHLERLPGNLDRVDELLAQGVIGAAEQNAADFQIATSVQAMLSIGDLRPYVEGRPCERYALDLIGPPRNQLPAGLPADWLPADSRPGSVNRWRQSMETRIERVVLETATHRISGDLSLPREGYRSRLSDFLNRGDIAFIPLTNAEMAPLADGETEQREFVAVSREHIQIAYPA